MKAILALIVLALAGCNGCQHNPPPTPVQPAFVADAAIDYSPPDGPATCLDACRNALRLGCSWAQPTPAGATCVDVCANNQAANIAPWDLDCRARKSSCGEVDACP